MAGGKGFLFRTDTVLPGFTVLKLSTKLDYIRWPGPAHIVLENHIDQQTRTKAKHQYHKCRLVSVWPQGVLKKTGNKNKKRSTCQYKAGQRCIGIEYVPGKTVDSNPSVMRLVYLSCHFHIYPGHGYQGRCQQKQQNRND